MGCIQVEKAWKGNLAQHSVVNSMVEGRNNFEIYPLLCRAPRVWGSGSRIRPMPLVLVSRTLNYFYQQCCGTTVAWVSPIVPRCTLGTYVPTRPQNMRQKGIR